MALGIADVYCVTDNPTRGKWIFKSRIYRKNLFIEIMYIVLLKVELNFFGLPPFSTSLNCACYLWHILN